MNENIHMETEQRWLPTNKSLRGFPRQIEIK